MEQPSSFTCLKKNIGRKTKKKCNRSKQYNLIYFIFVLYLLLLVFFFYKRVTRVELHGTFKHIKAYH